MCLTHAFTITQEMPAQTLEVTTTQRYSELTAIPSQTIITALVTVKNTVCPLYTLYGHCVFLILYTIQKSTSHRARLPV